MVPTAASSPAAMPITMSMTTALLAFTLALLSEGPPSPLLLELDAATADDDDDEVLDRDEDDDEVLDRDELDDAMLTELDDDPLHWLQIALMSMQVIGLTLAVWVVVIGMPNTTSTTSPQAFFLTVTVCVVVCKLTEQPDAERVWAVTVE